MKNKLIYPILLAVFFGLLLFSCEREDLEADELALLEQYIADNNITAQPTSTGLYVIDIKEGTGINPRLNQYVKVRYTGKLLSNGYVFDTTVTEDEDDNEARTFILGNLIQGWNEGLGLMKVGGKATLIVPSSIGYGSLGSGNNIPPYSTLIFEIELINAYNQ